MNGHITDTESIAELARQLEGVSFYEVIFDKQSAINGLIRQLKEVRFYEAPRKLKKREIRKIFNEKKEAPLPEPKKKERPKAEYSNTSPYGIAQEYLLGQEKTKRKWG